jgi:hypothetical protein
MLTDLSANELDLILSALAAVSPSGGGSDVYTLYRKLAAQTCRAPLPELEAELAMNVVRDYQESLT